VELVAAGAARAARARLTSAADAKITAMGAIEPRWASWSFLLYAGGLTILGAAASALGYLSDVHGDAAYVVWALVVFAAVAGVGLALRRDGGHPIAAGIFGFSSVVLFGALLTAIWTWFGWVDSDSSGFSGFDVGRLSLVLLTLVAALVALQLYRFPLIVLIGVLLAWFFVTDLLSGGGDWTAIVTFLVGLVFLALGLSLDAGPNRPYGMWVHVAAGLTIGGSIVNFLHHGNVEWAFIVVGGILFVLIADAVWRSSWAVLGAVGILAAAVHFTVELTHLHVTIFGEGLSNGSRGWAPAVVFAVAGLVLMLLGGLLARRAAARRVAAQPL
jgi:hypothetical protein